MNIKNPEFHDCECGFRWMHGRSGAHDCGPYYRQTIRHLRDAAAPQVIADERALPPIVGFGRFSDSSERGLLVTFKRRLTDEELVQARAALAATPVQAQEPVAGNAVQAILLSDMVEGSHPQYGNGLFATENCVTTLFRSPVQPLAAPDGWRDAALESAVQAVVDRAGESESIALINAFYAIRSLKKNRSALPESCSSSAAPAVQGDAKDAARWREALQYVGADRSPALGCDYFVLRGIHVTPGSNLIRGSVAGHFTAAIDAAIAAKAAAS